MAFQRNAFQQGAFQYDYGFDGDSFDPNSFDTEPSDFTATYAHAQAQARIVLQGTKFAQANALILGAYQKFAQANALITTYRGYSVGTTLSVTPVAGDLILHWIYGRDGGGFPTSGGTGWTKIDETWGGSFNDGIALWAKISDGTESGYVWPTTYSIQVYEIYSGPFDLTFRVSANNFSGSTATWTSSSITPVSGQQALIVSSAVWASSGLPTFSSSDTLTFAVNFGGEHPSATATYRGVPNTSGSYTASITSSVNTNNRGIVAAFLRNTTLKAAFAQAQASIIIGSRVRAYAQAQAFVYTIFPYDGKPVDDGATHLWKFGIDSNDSIGTKHGADNSVTHSQTGPWSGALSTNFSNSDSSYVGFTDAQNMPSGSSDRTIEFWAKTSKTSAGVPIGYGANGTRNQWVNVFDYVSDLDLSTYNVDLGVTDSNLHANDNWHHHAITYRSSTSLVEFFEDGVSKGTQNFGTLSTATGASPASGMRIGGLYYAGGFAFSGNLAYMAVYPTALSNLEIANHALGNSSIKVAQAQAYISTGGTTRWSHAQSQASIKQIYNRHAQAQASIKQTYNKHAQAQASIVYKRWANAQAQAIILRRVNEHAQAQTSVLQTYQAFGQAQTTLALRSWYVAQANAMIRGVGKVSAQAQALIDRPFRFAQAQAQIKNGDFVFAQAKTFIRRPRFAFAQARVFIVPTYKHAQAQALIGQRFGLAQAQASVASVVNRCAQAQALIIKGAGFAQAQAYMRGEIVRVFAQSQAQILQTYNVFAQAQAVTLRSARAYAQARCQIKSTGGRYHGAAQAYILNGQVYAQAQAQIIRKPFAHAQAQTLITRTQGYAQALADIRDQSTQVFNDVPSTYLVRFNEHYLPGYAQYEQFGSDNRIAAHEAAYQDGSLSEYLGFNDKDISMKMKVITDNLYMGKMYAQRAATIANMRSGYQKLWIASTTKYYLAKTSKISIEKNVSESGRHLEYSIEWKTRPWLLSEATETITGTGNIDTDAVNRTIADGGWTPARVKVTGTNITVSGYTSTGDFTGYFAVSGSVTNLIIDTESYTATINGQNMNRAMMNLDYAMYVGPGKTNFAVSGATSIEISYQNRWY